MHRIVGITLSFLVASLASSVAQGQTETVRYYHQDAIGSVLMITDEAGQVIQRYDYWPFGVPTEIPVVPESRRFAGKERDADTRFDYFGARDYQSLAGRFATPDPMTVNALRLVNPQRWNRYAYAVNNPLTFTDPTGLDAVVFNFVGGAYGAGHIGIMAVNPDGSGLYGGFNPVHGDRPFDSGSVFTIQVAPGSIALGDNGRPTPESWAMLKQRVRQDGNHDPRLIRAAYYKTSAVETAALEQFIRVTAESPPSYNVVTNSCLTFCIVGLHVAGVPAPARTSVGDAAPNWYFQSLWYLDMALRLNELLSRPTPNVTTSYCFQGQAGC